MSDYSTDNRVIGNAKEIAAGGVSSTNLTQINGNTVNTNGGNRDTGTQTITLADDDPALALLALVNNNTLKSADNVNPTAVTNGSDSGAISITTAISENFYLHHVTVHLSSAPTSAGEIIVELDALDGADYDTVLDRQEMQGKTDYSFIPPSPLLVEDGDEIKLTYSNPNSRTYGARIVTRGAYTPSG